MSRRPLILTLALVLGSGTFLWQQIAEAAPQRETIMGEVVDITGLLMKGTRGEEGAKAGQHHAGRGFPLGILTEEGDVYIAVYRNPAPASALETANDLLFDLMGKQVVAQGRLFEGSGLHLIEIAIVGEM